MFFRKNHIACSDILDLPRICHGFATRSGGVSVIPEVASMNTAVRMGDSPENVAENIALLTKYIGMEGSPVIYSRQIHSATVLTVTPDDICIDPESRELDGYVTDHSGIVLLVRSADCVPILFAGSKNDGTPVIGAAHAGWRGTVSRIAEAVVTKMCDLGTVRDSIRVAIGPAIHDCCFEVKRDFIDSVEKIAGTAFAARHIREKSGRYFASLIGMNKEILSDSGILPSHIDVSPDCTVHMSDVYHSHRATAGNRGTGGGIIGIRATEA